MGLPKITDHMFTLSMTPKQFQTAMQKLEAEGHVAQGNGGTIDGPMGVVIGYRYEPENQELAVTIVKRPAFLSEEMIAAQAEKWLGGAGS